MGSGTDLSAGFYAEVHAPGKAKTIDGTETFLKRLIRIEVPQEFTPEVIGRMKRDCERFAEILGNHPEDSAELFKAVTSNDLSSARAVATRLGVTEEGFIADGGGLIWWVVGAVVVAVIVASEGEAG